MIRYVRIDEVAVFRAWAYDYLSQQPHLGLTPKPVETQTIETHGDASHDNDATNANDNKRKRQCDEPAGGN